jgi:hypothetical protein
MVLALQKGECGSGSLKLQAALAGCFGKRFHSTVILRVTAVHLDTFYASRNRLLSNCFADFASRIAIATDFDGFTENSIFGTGTDNCLSGQIVDQLATEVLERTMDAQTWMISSALYLVANMATATQTPLFNNFILIHLDAVG